MISLDAVLASLSSPMVLAFLLGIIATLLRSDLKFPDGLYIGLTIYLLFSIGLKGGMKLSHTHFSDFVMPGMAAIAMCIIIPLIVFAVMHYIVGFDKINAAALAAHLGSVSTVTFSQAVGYLEEHQIAFEGFMPAILAIMEVPAIIVALLLAKKSMGKDSVQDNKQLMHELFTNKGSILLIGGLLIGLISGDKGYAQVAPLYDSAFKGVLCLFLLEVGLVTGRRIKDLKKVGFKLIIACLVLGFVHASIAIVLSHAIGLSEGGALIFAVLCASASYIAAPAAIRIALPKANPTYYLTASLVILFPFNVTLGIPIYHALTHYIYSL